MTSLNSRSLGLKLIVVCGLAILLEIPMLFLSTLVEDRTQRAATVVEQISGSSGGPQVFLGPTLAIPYTANASRGGVYLVFPSQGSALLKTVTEERHRSLFKVPVFQADVAFEADFDLTGVPAVNVPAAELDWSRAQVIAGVSDARGALADAMLTIDGNSSALLPVDSGQDMNFGGKFTLLGARTDARPGLKQHVTAAMRFSGAQRLAVLAFAKATRVTAQGDWASPGFDGAFLPVKRTVTPAGFSAEWFVPFIARGVRAEGPGESFAGLQATALGTSFIEMADPYQSVHRSTKYGLLFLGMIFLSYLVFETTAAKRVHPAQYILVGIAQVIFYLLLLSLSERIGFDWGFAIAGSATVLLLSLNAAWVFASRVQGARALAVFAALYGAIYTLLRMEDNALLLGAIISFLVVAVAMYLTRKIDWYNPLGDSQNRIDGSQAPAGSL